MDIHAQPSGVSIEEVKSRYDIPFNDYGIVVFHPVTSEVDTIANQAQSLFECLKATQKNYVVIAPNNDPGTEDIYKVINSLPADSFRLIPSMRFHYFSELMKNASIMVGNSSAGVREMPFLGKASIDIGSRQQDRSLAASVHHCNAFDVAKLRNLIVRLWGKTYSRDTSYGEGCSTEKFVACLKKDGFWDQSLQKTFFSGD